MSVGTATAIGLGLGAMGGLQVLGAHVQSKAAKEAAKIQAESAERATQFQTLMADRSLQAQNQAMYGNQNGPGGGNGLVSGGPFNSGGIQGAYNPYLNSNPATLSALHSFLGIPGAAQNQVAVPQGGYAPPPQSNYVVPGQVGAQWTQPTLSSLTTSAMTPPPVAPRRTLASVSQSYRGGQRA